MILSNNLKFDMWMTIIALISEQKTATMFSLSIQIPASYSHVFDIVKILKSKDLITIDSKGRKHVIELTEKGWHTAHYIKALKGIMEDKNGK
jgi:predicted transcriptional regulator